MPANCAPSTVAPMPVNDDWRRIDPDPDPDPHQLDNSLTSSLGSKRTIAGHIEPSHHSTVTPDISRRFFEHSVWWKTAFLGIKKLRTTASDKSILLRSLDSGKEKKMAAIAALRTCV